MAAGSDELCLLDANIRSLRDVPLQPQLTNLSLHSNKITYIENLHGLTQLHHLDLSSNQICQIEGLSSLTSLRTLNLACNFIKRIEGLGGLKSLVKLNLSYNQIHDVTGLQDLSGASFRITDIELQGNNISNLIILSNSIKGLCYLKKLKLSYMGASNAVCNLSEYRTQLFAIAAHLVDLDGKDRYGEPCIDLNATQDLPGLEKYLDYLISNSSSDQEAVVLATPKINAALEAFKQRGVTSPEVTSGYSETDISRRSEARNDSTDSSYKNRLEQLEQQLAQLLTDPSSKSKSVKNVNVLKKLEAKRDVDYTDESDEDVRPKSKAGRGRKGTRIPSYQRSTSASRGKAPNNADNSTGTQNDTSRSRECRSRSRSLSPQRRPMVGRALKPVTAIAVDEKCRSDVQNTYVSLMKELETERERRWKAEQATRKLVDHIREMQAKAKEGENMSEVASEANKQLKTSLSSEREVRLKLQAQVEVLGEEAAELKEKLEKSEQTRVELATSLHEMESARNSAEQERLSQQAHDAGKVQKAMLSAAALRREVEMLQAQVTDARGKISQLQSLLADREEQHRKEMTNRYSVGSREFQELLQQEVRKVEGVKTAEIAAQQTQMEALSRRYTELEDEFRMALTIEANRYEEIKTAFERVSSENAENKQALLVAERKDTSSAEMIAELTALVKEQKGRLSELAKVKAEQTADFQQRLGTMETHLDEARRRMVQLELLKKEKLKLESTVAGQESVIEGLKAERRLWGAELAQQGASLAQDRGTMQAKIDTLQAEISVLKQKLEAETDAVRIKAKLVEDQTETIRRLKDGITERDAQIRQARQDAVTTQRQLEEQLSSELSATAAAEERCERLAERKRELKDQVDELTEQLECARRERDGLARRWQEKAGTIKQLEEQVSEMQRSWQQKEAALSADRERAVNAAGVAVDKLRAMDAAFRQQLDSKEAAHREALTALAEEKQAEIDAANKRVIETEEEMRELLRETDMHKRTMEEKVKKLTRAMGELQQDLF